ncbi:hypothetical protein CRYUN_Cryun05aG0188100 [Craigia yunnanensis]
MSPAAVEIRSPDTFSSNAKPSSAPQNPNAIPENFTAFPQNNHSHMNSSSSSSFSSSFGNAGEFDCGFGFSSWSGYHPKSAASVRPRPRLVKVRKQLNGKVRTGQSEIGSGFNPFNQSGQKSGPISTSGNLSSSGFLDSLNIVNNDNNYNNSRFVFGVNNGSDRESSENVEVEKGNEEPFREFENVGFVFEANLRGGMEKLGSEKCGKFGFVFGDNGSDGAVKSNPGKGESSDFAVRLDGSRGKMKVQAGAQGSKDSNLEFAFGLTKSDLASNLDSGKGDFCETLTEPDFSDAGFVLGSSQSDLKSTFKSDKIEPTNVVKRSSSVFGANHLTSSSFNLERRESGKNFGQSVSGDLEKMNMKAETESQKMESTTVNFNANGSESSIGDFTNGFFVFGATSSKGSFCNQCKDGVNSSSENSGVSASKVRCKDVSENSNNIGSSFSANSIFILQHDLQKLNISCYKNVAGTDTNEDSDTKANSETIFVFGSSEKASSPSKKAPESGPSEDKSSNGNVNGAVSCNSCNKDNVGISGSKPFTFQAGIDKTSDIEKSFQGHARDDLELNGTDACTSLNLNSQGNCHVIGAAAVGTERNDESCSSSTLYQSGISFNDFKTPKWDPSFFKENIVPEVDRKLEFGVKSGLIKEKRIKKMRGKSKKSYLYKHCSKQHHVPKESSAQENQDSSQCYSPMDFSPYQEMTAADQSSKETPQASEEPHPLEYNSIPSVLCSSILTTPEAECPATAQKGSDSNEGDQKHGEQNEENFGYDHESIFVGDGPSRESACEAETASNTFKSDGFCGSGAANVGGAEGPNGTKENKHPTQSCFNSGLEDERNFTFSVTSTSGQGSSSFRKHQLRKKSKVKIGKCPATAQKGSDSNEGDQKHGEQNEENFGYDHESIFVGDGPSRESACEAETASNTFKSDGFCSSGAANVGGAKGLNGTQENKHPTQSCFNSGLEDERNFTFPVTSTSGQGSSSFRKRQLRKKSKVKIGKCPATAQKGSDSNEGDQKHGEQNEENFGYDHESIFVGDGPSRESACEAETASNTFKSDGFCSSGAANVGGAEGLNGTKENKHPTQSFFNSGLEDERNFTFSVTSTSGQGSSSFRKCQLRKKSKVKIGKCPATAQKGSDSNEGDQKHGEQNEENFGYDHESIFVGDGPSRESACEAETASNTFKSDGFCSSGAANVGGAKGLNGTQENKHPTQSCFNSGLEDERNFTFPVTSTSGQGSSSFRKRQLRKKSKVKIGKCPATAQKGSDSNEGDQKHGEQNEENFGYDHESIFVGDGPSRESACEAETASNTFKSDGFCSSGAANVGGAEGLNGTKENKHPTQSFFNSGLEDERNFTFSVTSTSGQGSSSFRKCQLRKKSKVKIGKCPATAQKGSDSNEGDQKHGEQNEENFGYDHESIFVGDGPSRESACEAETASNTFKSDGFCSSGAANVGGAEGLNGTQENKHPTQSCFNSGLEDERNFTFSVTSTSGQGSSSFRKRQLRKKSKVKIGNASFIITPIPGVKGGSSSVQFSPCDPVECEQKDKSTYYSKEENEQLKQGSNSSTAAVHEACEMWRLRGNQAYRNDNLSKAEEFYTQGINSVPSKETSCFSIKPLVLCYSNRAATRMSLGRMREALADCLMAAALDPNFLKVYVRAANCHLLLGETENAIWYFRKCLGSGADVCLDRRITIDAADGLQKAQDCKFQSNR